jgi:two-component system phosphate regulon sensor histidine kinase PhoR
MLHMNGGSIYIKAFRKGDRVVVTVEDAGFGIFRDNLEKVFSRFYRVDQCRSKGTGGVELGLSICKEIMKLHNRDIKAESEEFRGVKVYLYFTVVEYF